MELSCYPALDVATYGENFRRLRGRRSQELIADRLKIKRQANISAIELSRKVPTPALIKRHAAALETDPAELLRDVTTPYDELRGGLPVIASQAINDLLLQITDQEELDWIEAQVRRLVRGAPPHVRTGAMKPKRTGVRPTGTARR